MLGFMYVYSQEQKKIFLRSCAHILIPIKKPSEKSFDAST